MHFLYPQFLWALTALAIPVAIHLFNFRRFKKIYFSNIRFLREVQEQTRNRNRLRHLLILLMRMLAIAFLVLAFARPYDPDAMASKPKGKTSVSVYVDNSYSMDALGTGGLLFDLACDQAIAIANSHQESDRFQLLTNDMEGFRDRFVARNEFIRQVNELKISLGARKLSVIAGRQQDLLQQAETPGKVAYMISDFQKSTADVAAFPTTPYSTLMIPVEAESRANLWIDSVWFESPVRQLGGQEKMMVKVRNSGEQSAENLRITADINGTTRIGNVAVPAQGEEITEIGYTNNTATNYNCKVWLEAGNEQPAFDDTLYLSYRVEKQINVLDLTNGDLPSDPVGSVFANDPLFNLVRVNARSFDASTLPGFQLVVLNSLDDPGSGLASELNEYVKAGGSVFLFPGEKASVTGWNSLLRELGLPTFIARDTARNAVTSVNTDHPLFFGVLEKSAERMTLPRVRIHYPSMRSTASGEEVLMTMQDGSSFLSAFRLNGGNIFRSAVPATEAGGSFVRHAFFVTCLIRAAELSLLGNPSYVTIGRDRSVRIRLKEDNPEQRFSVTSGGQAFIPMVVKNSRSSADLILSSDDGNAFVRQAGIYTVFSGDQDIMRFGANYHRLESLLDPLQPDDIRSAIESAGITGYQVSDAISAQSSTEMLALNRSGEYWRLCLILALAFLAIEILLLRLWKA